MADPTQDPTQKLPLHNDPETFDDPIRKVGSDATATFNNSDSNPTEHASSEALESATTVEGEDEDGNVLAGIDMPNTSLTGGLPADPEAGEGGPVDSVEDDEEDEDEEDDDDDEDDEDEEDDDSDDLRV